MTMPGLNKGFDIMSLRKLVPRATEVPDIAPARCPSSDAETRGS